MAPSKLRKAIGAVKDRTSIGLARVHSSDSISDIDVAIVKATRHEEYPPDERHIREILSLTSYSRFNVSACVATISRRLTKTKNWVVALKTLMLIQRLIAEGDWSYEEEIFFATRRGARLLNMSDFRDTSISNAWDYSAFVRTYALYLDENLEFKMQNRRGKHSASAYEEDEEEQIGRNAILSRATPVHEMETEQIISRAQHLMHLLERFLACRPTGAAKTNRIVAVALHPIVRESFHLYDEITDILYILIERFMELDVPESVKVHEIFSRASMQNEELDVFYNWCKKIGIGRSYEYPDVEKISQKKLDVMDDYIKEKTAMTRNRKARSPEPRQITAQEEPKKPEPKPELEEDKKPVKELSPLRQYPEIGHEVKQQEEKKERQNNTTANVHLFNFGENAPTKVGDKLASALFDGSLATSAPTMNNSSSWVAFHGTGSREKPPMQSGSHLPNQQPTLAGRFDQLRLDGMHQYGANKDRVTSFDVTATGSGRSMPVVAEEKLALQTLPAPPDAGRANGLHPQVDPFATSLFMAPPAYVHKPELENKQRLFMQEQVIWQQYAREETQGEVGFTRVQQHCPYQAGGYTHTY